MMRSAFLAFAALGVAAAPGCGTLYQVTQESDLGVFAGTRFDVDDWQLVLDVPLSLVADTCLLPITMPVTLWKNAPPSRVQRTTEELELFSSLLDRAQKERKSIPSDRTPSLAEMLHRYSPIDFAAFVHRRRIVTLDGTQIRSPDEILLFPLSRALVLDLWGHPYRLSWSPSPVFARLFSAPPDYELLSVGPNGVQDRCPDYIGCGDDVFYEFPFFSDL